MDFNSAYRLYLQLKEQYEQGQINVDEFERRVNDLVVTDSAGDQWQIGVKTGKWYRFDDQTWVEDIPREFVRPSNAFSPKVVRVPPAPAVAPQSASTYQDQNQLGKNKWFSGFLIIGALGLCCLIFAVGGWLAWRNNLLPLPINSPTVASLVSPSPALVIPIVTAVIPSMASPEPIAGPGFDPELVQFEDDFSNPNSGWRTFQDSDGSADYSNGGFRIKVTGASYLLWSNPNQSLQNDITIHVDATKTGGPDDNAFGVICRYQGSDNFYYLFITSDGYAGISMYKNNEMVVLTGNSLIYSDAIKQGVATNRIRADCEGSTLALYANDQQIASARDSSFGGGDVGLMARAYKTPGVDILFDNLIVFKAGY